MAILKVKSIEKLLSFLLADLLQRFLHGERRARVLGHRISLHFGLHPVDGKDVDLRSSEAPVFFSQGFFGSWIGHERRMILVH